MPCWPAAARYWRNARASARRSRELLRPRLGIAKHGLDILGRLTCALRQLLHLILHPPPAPPEKPRPPSPARAASMAAFKASRLVCSAIPLITLTTRAICP